jgi:hypothetical protein
MAFMTIDDRIPNCLPETKTSCAVLLPRYARHCRRKSAPALVQSRVTLTFRTNIQRLIDFPVYSWSGNSYDEMSMQPNRIHSFKILIQHKFLIALERLRPKPSFVDR